MAKTLWETLKPLEAKANSLRTQLANVERQMQETVAAWMKSGSPPAAKAGSSPGPTRSSEGAPKAGGPRTTKADGKTFTDQVLAQVTGNRTAASIVASLGLKASDRRKVYKVLLKAAQAGRIAKVGEGKFAPKK